MCVRSITGEPSYIIIIINALQCWPSTNYRMNDINDKGSLATLKVLAGLQLARP